MKLLKWYDCKCVIQFVITIPFTSEASESKWLNNQTWTFRLKLHKHYDWKMPIHLYQNDVYNLKWRFIEQMPKQKRSGPSGLTKAQMISLLICPSTRKAQICLQVKLQRANRYTIRYGPSDLLLKYKSRPSSRRQWHIDCSGCPAKQKKFSCRPLQDEHASLTKKKEWVMVWIGSHVYMQNVHLN